MDGLRELWGTGVFHCPYCHGWEVRDQPFVLIAQDGRAVHLAKLLRGWSQNVTVCPVDPTAIAAADVQDLVQLGVRFEAPVSALVRGPNGTVGDVVLESGTHLGAAAVFTSAPVRQASPLPERLGCTSVAVQDDGTRVVTARSEPSNSISTYTLYPCP